MKAIGKFIVVEENRESYKSKGGLLLTGEDKVGSEASNLCEGNNRRRPGPI